MFENLKKALEAEYADRARLLTFYVENGYLPTWAEENRKTPDEGIKRWSTPKKWEAYQAGTLSREKSVQLATARALRDLDKTHAARLQKLDRIQTAPDLEFITINVEWKRNRTWGNNPTAYVVTNEAETYTGTASGCGYDKASAALADALNASPAVLKTLYTAAENALASGQSFKRYNEMTVTWRDVLGYGSGYSIPPYFEGGAGVSCLETIFNRCGYTFRQTASAKHFDAYNVARKGE